MNVSQRIQTVSRLFLDTPPIVYYVEENALYLPRVVPVFDRIDAGELLAVTSPITLSECLVAPFRANNIELLQEFRDLIAANANMHFRMIDATIAEKAAEFRAHYNLSLTDAYQMAVALSAGCDAFFTNDARLKRVTEINVLVLDDLEPG